MTNQQKQWFPLSSANVVNEDGFPVSYYDLTQFKDDDTIYVGDDLFAFNKPFEDLREIIITMRENFDEKVFEISTNYPKKLVEFLKEYNDKQENFFRGLALKHAISLIASMEDFFDSLKDINLTLHHNNQTFHITLDEAAKGIYYNKIKDVDSLMCQTQEANQKVSEVPISFLKVYKRR